MAKTAERDETVKRFQTAVNMRRSELRTWLRTDESKSVGQKRGGGEATGHKMGKRIVTLLGKKKSKLTDDDLKAMDKVVGYVARHRKQRPKQVKGSRWAYSLRNWGHDPLK